MTRIGVRGGFKSHSRALGAPSACQSQPLPWRLIAALGGVGAAAATGPVDNCQPRSTCFKPVTISAQPWKSTAQPVLPNTIRSARMPDPEPG